MVSFAVTSSSAVIAFSVGITSSAIDVGADGIATVVITRCLYQ